jgi:DNA-binding response OmpR family regulator
MSANLRPRPKRVLIVEDDDRLRHVIYKTLLHAGFNPLQAATGRQALQLLETEGPSIVLLDLELPDNKDFTLMHSIQRRGPGTPQIVVVTGNERARFHATEVGAEIEHWLVKPVSMRTLVDYLQRMLAANQAPPLPTSALPQQFLSNSPLAPRAWERGRG